MNHLLQLSSLLLIILFLLLLYNKTNYSVNQPITGDAKLISIIIGKREYFISELDKNKPNKIIYNKDGTPIYIDLTGIRYYYGITNQPNPILRLYKLPDNIPQPNPNNPTIVDSFQDITIQNGKKISLKDLSTLLDKYYKFNNSDDITNSIMKQFYTENKIYLIEAFTTNNNIYYYSSIDIGNRSKIIYRTDGTPLSYDLKYALYIDSYLNNSNINTYSVYMTTYSSDTNINKKTNIRNYFYLSINGSTGETIGTMLKNLNTAEFRLMVPTSNENGATTDITEWIRSL